MHGISPILFVVAEVEGILALKAVGESIGSLYYYYSSSLRAEAGDTTVKLPKNSSLACSYYWAKLLLQVIPVRLSVELEMFVDWALLIEATPTGFDEEPRCFGQEGSEVAAYARYTFGGVNLTRYSSRSRNACIEAMQPRPSSLATCFSQLFKFMICSSRTRRLLSLLITWICLRPPKSKPLLAISLNEALKKSMII